MYSFLVARIFKIKHYFTIIIGVWCGHLFSSLNYMLNYVFKIVFITFYLLGFNSSLVGEINLPTFIFSIGQLFNTTRNVQYLKSKQKSDLRDKTWKLQLGSTTYWYEDEKLFTSLSLSNCAKPGRLGRKRRGVF